MRRSSDRAGTELLAALVAVAAVCTGLSLYAGALDVPAPTPDATVAAERLLEETHAETNELGVVDPAALGPAVAGLETGRQVNVTLRSGSLERRFGPAPPADVASASRRVSVRHRPGEVRPGRLRVVVW